MKYRLNVFYKGRPSAIFETADAGKTYTEVWRTDVLQDRVDWVYGLTGTELKFCSQNVVDFLEDRVPQRNRENLEDILKELKLECWDPLAIVEKTGGKFLSDFFTINVEVVND